MKYDLSAGMFPLLFDRYSFACLKANGCTSLSKQNIRREYRAMVRRTPSLPKDSPFIGAVLMGCYVLSFYKACPDLINEEIAGWLLPYAPAGLW